MEGRGEGLVYAARGVREELRELGGGEIAAPLHQAAFLQVEQDFRQPVLAGHGGVDHDVAAAAEGLVVKLHGVGRR